jgi:hypothetical protein
VYLKEGEKMKKISMFLIVFVVLFGFSFQVNAALVDNGDGTITDTDLGIMWIQDANYAKTSGYFAADTYGKMTWYEAMTWADTLVYAGYDNWRLPSADIFCLRAEAGCTNSEIGHLFYTELGNDTLPGLENTNPFINVQNDWYWTKERAMDNDRVIDFCFDEGMQDYQNMNWARDYALAVRTIAPSVVPEPISSTLFLIGAGVLAGRRYIRKRK